MESVIANSQIFEYSLSIMMKKNYLTILFLLVSLLGYSQEAKTIENKEIVPILKFEDDIYNTAGVDVIPQFPGGITEFYKFIAKNYRRPADDKLHGKVFVTFIIQKDGSIDDVKVLRDIGYGTGQEAVRVLKNSPNWSPGEKNGKKVRVLYSLPIQL
jgi:hypothetical protein